MRARIDTNKDEKTLVGDFCNKTNKHKSWNFMNEEKVKLVCAFNKSVNRRAHYDKLLYVA
jgi:hypothetical protein